MLHLLFVERRSPSVSTGRILRPRGIGSQTHPRAGELLRIVRLSNINLLGRDCVPFGNISIRFDLLAKQVLLIDLLLDFEHLNFLLIKLVLVLGAERRRTHRLLQLPLSINIS